MVPTGYMVVQALISSTGRIHNQANRIFFLFKVNLFHIVYSPETALLSTLAGRQSLFHSGFQLFRSSSICCCPFSSHWALSMIIWKRTRSRRLLLMRIWKPSRLRQSWNRSSACRIHFLPFFHIIKCQSLKQRNLFLCLVPV